MFDLFGRKRIAELEKANANLNRRLQEWEDGTGRKLNRIEAQLSTITLGLGRVIAKLDARFAEDESNASPERKAESDRIAAAILRAEALARAPYNIDHEAQP